MIDSVLPWPCHSGCLCHGCLEGKEACREARLITELLTEDALELRADIFQWRSGCWAVQHSQVLLCKQWWWCCCQLQVALCWRWSRGWDSVSPQGLCGCFPGITPPSGEETQSIYLKWVCVKMVSFSWLQHRGFFSLLMYLFIYWREFFRRMSELFWMCLSGVWP